MKRLCMCIISTLLALALCACAAGGAPSAAESGFNLQKAKPLLDALAEAQAYDVGARFTDGPGAYYFTNTVYALLRDAALGEDYEAFSSGAEGEYTILCADMQGLYAALFAGGAYPGLDALSNNVEFDEVSAYFHAEPRPALMSVMSFPVGGITSAANGDYLIYATLNGQNAATGNTADLGDYCITVRNDPDALYGCLVVALEPYQTGAPASPPEPGPSASQKPYAAFDAFFGYDTQDALDDIGALITSTAYACDHYGRSFEGAPDDEALWLGLYALINTMGTRLAGVTRSENGYVMVRDDVLTLYWDVYRDAADDLPAVPESIAQKISLEGEYYTFSFEAMPTIAITPLEAGTNEASFLVACDGGDVLVVLQKSDTSNYGLFIGSVALQ